MTSKKDTDDQQSNDEDEFFTGSNKFKQMMFENLNGISAKFNFKYPINPKLTYDYPPINPIICQNIINTLYKNPKFYTQTLHLMNKMNLPCPLVDYVRDPYFNVNPNPAIAIVSSTKSETEMPKDCQKHLIEQNESSSESEIESEIESSAPGGGTITTPVESDVKKIKIKSILKSTNAQPNTEKVKLDDVFDFNDQN
jgi:U11/U12 small nuclear ribonucleoprotein SNRNP65